MEELSKLHPAAQVACIIGSAAFACVFVWQAFKTLREG